MKKLIMRSTLLTALFSLILSTAVMAAILPDDIQKAYTYSNDQKPIPAPSSHTLDAVLSADSLGIQSLNDISDIAVHDGVLYILDKKAGHIVAVNSDYTLSGVLGNDAGLSNPEGMYITPNGYIYIADTGNARVVKLDTQGKLLAIIGAPDPAQTLSNVEYQPLKIVVDAGERLYILANNETNGIYQLDIEGNFLGYFGSVPVVPNLLELFWRTFSTKEQLARMLLFVPTEYSSIDMDIEGFIYTTVATNTDAEMVSFIQGGGKNKQLAPIRRLNPKSIDVLTRNGSMPPAGDLITESTERTTGNASRFIDVSVRNDGTYAALDSTRSRVFTYDEDGNLLYIFGEKSDTVSGFINPVSLSWWGDKIAVADQGNRAVKVFSPTNYALLIHEAIASDKSGDFDKAEQCWQAVLRMHSGNGLAYLGMGRQAMRKADYKLAMEWFRRGKSQIFYSKTFRLYRQQIGFMLTGAAIVSILLLVVGITLWRRFSKGRISKKRKSSSSLRKLFKEICYGFYIMRHPFDGFWDMGNEKRGSLKASTVILGCVITLNLVGFYVTGYLVAGDNKTLSNLLIQGVMGILLPVGLWCAANWSVTTLMNGSGTLKRIYMYTCYSLTPMLIGLPLLILLSNVLTLDEMSLYSIVKLLMFIWVGFLIFSGTLVVHQYLALRTFVTILVIIVAMGIIVFLFLLGITIVQQMTEFLFLLIEEIQLRS